MYNNSAGYDCLYTIAIYESKDCSVASLHSYGCSLRLYVADLRTGGLEEL